MNAKICYSAAILTVLLAACGGKSDDEGDDGADTGGASTGGVLSTGGARTGGATTGGARTGGATNGGDEAGGAETGGDEAGGAETGGAATGGAEVGGEDAGGAETGGATTGGAEVGGDEAGGAETGGAAAGGAETAGSAGATSEAGAAGASALGGAAGSGQGDAGAAGASVTIDIGDCDELTPCGGDIEGTWTYTAGCFDPAALGMDEETLGLLTAVCPTATYETTFEVTGTVSFADGAVVRDGGWSAEFDLVVPASCTLLGPCADLQPTIEVFAPEATVACVENTESCDCKVSQGAEGWEATSYTVDGNVLTLSDGRTFDYCVSGTAMEYVETSEDPEPGTFQLTLE